MNGPQVRRVYENPDATEGTRVLVDRLWPRGISKEAVRLDEWRKDVAPSTELRKWYNHEPDKFDEFARRYRDELSDPAGKQALDHLAALLACGPVTLLTATKDVAHSGAAVLAELLGRRVVSRGE